jgi:hypothetical protein
MREAISVPPVSSIPHGVYTAILPLFLGRVINHNSQGVDFHDHKIKPVSSHYEGLYDKVGKARTCDAVNIRGSGGMIFGYYLLKT